MADEALFAVRTHVCGNAIDDAPSNEYVNDIVSTLAELVEFYHPKLVDGNDLSNDGATVRYDVSADDQQAP